MKAMQHEVYGIKCDAKGCDYHDDTAKLEEYDKYLDKPCPKCGANLLTFEDLILVKKFLSLEKFIKEIHGEVEEQEVVRIAVNMDGTGKADLQIIEDEES